MLAGCGDDDSGTAADAGSADGEAWELAPPAPPESPAPAAITPCPAGWRELPAPTEDGVATCDPWPAAGREACAAADQAHFPGEAGCRRIGSACPAGDWTAGLPATGVLYVRAGAPAGGAGTPASPFSTIAAAAAAAAPGTVIALAKGSYDESVQLAAGVTLQGACVAETVVAPSAASDTEGAITATGAGAAVRDLRVGGERMGIIAGAGATVELRGVLISGVRVRGWFLPGGGGDGEDVVIRDTRARGDGLHGRGIQAQEGAALDARRVVVERNRDSGVIVFDGGTTLTLADAAIVETATRAGNFGRGVEVNDGSSVTLTRTVVEANHDLGVAAFGVGTEVTLVESLVRATEARDADGDYGRGLAADGGARLVAGRTVIDGNRDIGVFGDNGATLELTDVVVANTRGKATVVAEDTGHGISMQGAARLTATRLHAAGNHTLGIFATAVGTELMLTDTVVQDTQAQEQAQLFGRGVNVQDGARLVFTRAALRRNHEVALFLDGAGTVATLTDVTVSDTLSEPASADYGRGVMVQVAADLQATRMRVEASRDVGIAVLGDGHATLEDVVVTGTVSREFDGQMGRGIEVGWGSRVEAGRLLIGDNRQVGLMVAGGSTLVATDVEIRDTAFADCAATTCQGLGQGSGLASVVDSSATVTRFVLTGSALCGVQVARGGTADLEHGVVAGNTIGANVQTEGFDVIRLQRDVVYRDNERNLDAAALPLPDATPPPP